MMDVTDGIAGTISRPDLGDSSPIPSFARRDPFSARPPVRRARRRGRPEAHASVNLSIRRPARGPQPRSDQVLQISIKPVNWLGVTESGLVPYSSGFASFQSSTTSCMASMIRGNLLAPDWGGDPRHPPGSLQMRRRNNDSNRSSAARSLSAHPRPDRWNRPDCSPRAGCGVMKQWCPVPQVRRAGGAHRASNPGFLNRSSLRLCGSLRLCVTLFMPQPCARARRSYGRGSSFGPPACGGSSVRTGSFLIAGMSWDRRTTRSARGSARPEPALYYHPGPEDRFEEESRGLDRAGTAGDLGRAGDEPSRGARRVQPRHPADPVGPLLPVPRARRGQAQGRPAARSRVVGQGRSRRPPRDRPGRPGRQRALSPDHRRGCRRADAAAEVRQDPHRVPDRDAPPLDRRGGAMAAALGVHPAGAAPDPPSSAARGGSGTRSTRSSWPGWSARGSRLRPRPSGASCSGV